MIQWAHRIEGVRSMSRSRSYGGASRTQVSVGMPEADADAASRGFSNPFPSAFQLGCDGHDANVPTRRLPEPVECRQRGQQQVFRRMNASSNVTEKRSLQVNTEGPSSIRTRIVVPRRGLNRIRQAIKGGPSLIERRCDGRRKITGHAMFEKQLLHCRQPRCVDFQYILTLSAVNMNIIKAGGHT